MCNSKSALRIGLAAAVVVMTGLAAAPISAQQRSAMDHDAMNVTCDAFQRWGAGGWMAVAPTMMNIDNGMIFSFQPGDSMGPGSTINGVAVPIILDRHCGNM